MSPGVDKVRGSLPSLTLRPRQGLEITSKQLGTGFAQYRRCNGGPARAARRARMQPSVVTDLHGGVSIRAHRSPLGSHLPRAPRFVLRDLTAIIDFGTSYEVGEVIDISASGCMIRFAKRLLPGLCFELMLDHRHDAGLPLEFAVRVVRVDHPVGVPPLIAVEFTDLSAIEQERLHCFVVGHGVGVDRVRRRRSA